MADALDRLVSSYEQGPLDRLTVPDLRARRAALQETELALSYARRLVQGRLDIVLDERDHRAGGGASRGVAQRIADLPKILSERPAGTARGALPEVAFPGAAVDEIIADVDRVIDATVLGSLSALPDDRLGVAIDELAAMEQRISQLRHGLHTSIDAVQEEMLRRYKSGEASIDAAFP